MPKYCTNCGKPLTPGVRFCTFCGFELPEDALDLPEPQSDSFENEATMTQLVDQINNMDNTEALFDTQELPYIEEPDPEPVIVQKKEPEKPIQKTEQIQEEQKVVYKHRKWPWILLLIIALLCAGTYWSYNNRPDILDSVLEQITEWTGIEFPKFDTEIKDDNGEVIPEETAKPEITANPEALGNALGTLRVTVTQLHVRTEPTQESELVTDAKEGATYTYYAVEEAEGYTWYRIGKTQWIADQGEWLEISPFETE